MLTIFASSVLFFGVWFLYVFVFGVNGKNFMAIGCRDIVLDVDRRKAIDQDEDQVP